MLGRRQQPEATDARIAEVRGRQREDELRRDPSDIPGMTQTELNKVIDTDSIPTALLNDVLNR
jgi:hypothetical protein